MASLPRESSRESANTQWIQETWIVRKERTGARAAEMGGSKSTWSNTGISPIQWPSRQEEQRVQSSEVREDEQRLGPRPLSKTDFILLFALTGFGATVYLAVLRGCFQLGILRLFQHCSEDHVMLGVEPKSQPTEQFSNSIQNLFFFFICSAKISFIQVLYQ